VNWFKTWNNLPSMPQDASNSDSPSTGHGLPGRLVIVSGPSGAGKSTVVQRLLRECDLPLTMSVSATTRDPRPGETDGKDYLFISSDEFNRRREAGEFLECKEVFKLGRWYGTLRDQVASGLKAGQLVILEIDVQGALNVLDNREFNPITLFIHPGSMDELEARLRKRGTETEQAITARLETAAGEMRFMPQYQYEIINGSVDAAVAEICQILRDQKENERCSKN